MMILMEEPPWNVPRSWKYGWRRGCAWEYLGWKFEDVGLCLVILGREEEKKREREDGYLDSWDLGLHSG